MPKMPWWFYYFFDGLDDFLPLLPSNPARYIEKKTRVSWLVFKDGYFGNNISC